MSSVTAKSVSEAPSTEIVTPASGMLIDPRPSESGRSSEANTRPKTRVQRPSGQFSQPNDVIDSVSKSMIAAPPGWPSPSVSACSPRSSTS